MIWGKKDERRLRAVSEETKTACQGEKPGPRASAEKGDCFHWPVRMTVGVGAGLALGSLGAQSEEEEGRRGVGGEGEEEEQ